MFPTISSTLSQTLINKKIDQEILEKLKNQEQKPERIYDSVDKLKRYFLWTLIIAVVTIVLPIIGLIIILPWFLKIIKKTLPKTSWINRKEDKI